MNEKLLSVLNHPIRVPVAVGVLSLGSGLALGYILGRRNRKVVFRELPSGLSFGFNLPEKDEIRESVTEALEEIRVKPEPVVIDIPPEVPETREDVKDFLERKFQERLMHDPEEGEIEPLGIVDDSEESEPDEVKHNIFAGNDIDWDLEEEVKTRSNTEPYVIHKDEFYADERDYSQLSLTYYAGDDILADQDDSPIYNHSQVVGTLRFGHGSGDPNVFYVRNDKNRAEYEIIRHEGLFSEEVLGLEIESNARARDLRHSAVPKFRDD